MAEVRGRRDGRHHHRHKATPHYSGSGYICSGAIGIASSVKAENTFTGGGEATPRDRRVTKTVSAALSWGVIGHTQKATLDNTETWEGVFEFELFV